MSEPVLDQVLRDIQDILVPIRAIEINGVLVWAIVVENDDK